jgi:ribose/xylose/arabinose/galactoside ABC-type transport system permease subunit
MQPLFFSVQNFTNIVLQNSYLIVVSCGVGIIMISGGTDLSVSFEIALSAVIMAAGMMWWNLPIFISILLGLLVAIVLGMINGLLSVILKIHSMIITLATMTIFQGIAYLITENQSIFNLPPQFKVIGQGFMLGIPNTFIIALIVFALTYFFLNYTYYGRYIYAVGSNFQASQLSGINVKYIKVLAFATGGLIIGIGTILLLSRTGSANATFASGTEFNAITAAVLGGISLKGGEGKIGGVFIGVLILGVLSNGMQLIGFDLNAQYIAKGTLLLLAIGFDTYQRSESRIKPNLKEGK